MIVLVATANQSLSSLVPDGEQRINFKVHAAWDASIFLSSRFSPNIALSTSDFEDSSLPSFAIQFTTFLGGGMAMALKFAHPLTDAHGMSHFVRDWAAACRAMAAGSAVPIMTPMFEPQMLDKCAADDINAAHAEAKLVTQAAALPTRLVDIGGRSTMEKLNPDSNRAQGHCSRCSWNEIAVVGMGYDLSCAALRATFLRNRA